MDADVEISKPGENSHSVAAKDVSFKITTRNDTLIKAMLIFHHEGEDACIGMFPQDGRGAVIILKKLLEIIKKSKTGLLALDNQDKMMIRKELLQVKKLELQNNQIVDVSPLAGLINLKELRLGGNPIVDTSPLRSLNRKAIHGVVVERGGCCTIV